MPHQNCELHLVSIPFTDGFLMQDDDDDDGEFEMYRVQGTLREWVTRDEVRRFIAKKFKEFLLTYVNPKNEHGDFEYVRLINEMVSGRISPCASFLTCEIVKVNCHYPLLAHLFSCSCFLYGLI